jgi:hypothetical protein
LNVSPEKSAADNHGDPTPIDLLAAMQQPEPHCNIFIFILSPSINRQLPHPSTAKAFLAEKSASHFGRTRL